MPQLIDDNGESPMAYNSILVSPEKLSIFGSELCLKIVKELAKKPCCAMDLARKLEQHEQKIYYHLRNLDRAGIINQIRTEQRYGMTAKIYAVVSPVVATRLYNDGYPVENEVQIRNPKIEKFLHPFIKDGKLNAKIVIGDPYPHGKYDSAATEGAHVFDLALMLGRFLKDPKFPNYKLDTETNENDLKNNLILVGNAKTNTIIDRINSQLPVYFDEKSGYITLKSTGKIYKDSRTSIILKWDNPFDKSKKILLIGGIRTRGARASVIALTQHLDKIIRSTNEDGNVIKIIEGVDRDGDMVVDNVKFLG